MPFGEFEEEVKTSFSHALGSKSNNHFVISISNSNTPLGQCLDKALLAMKMSNSTKDTKRQQYEEKDLRADGEEKHTSVHYIDSDAMQSIRQAFGGSMARLQIRESQNLTIGSSYENAPSSKRRSRESAPRALLYGRLDHYNRVGQNWRLVAENISVSEKRPFLHERAAKRKQHSFWDSNSAHCEGEQGERQQEQNKSGGLAFRLGHEIQILGYNDS